MDCSPPSLSVHGIFQARILEWVAIPFCRASSLPMDQSQVPCIAGGFFTIRDTREMAFMFCCRHPGLETKILHYSIQYCTVKYTKAQPLVAGAHTWQCTPDSSVQFSHSVVSDSLQPHGCKGSMPGFPVHHQIPELAQTHAHWVSDAIQPSHPLITRHVNY